ncbi:MAG: hypothetical protein PF495_00545 [Spirochaetales bacterium]|jgi:hypothetical protein|nr:hypothetical protein [Spirochaetales bacterium]
MTLNQFRNMFPDEGACRKYLEKVIWLSCRVWMLEILVAQKRLCPPRPLRVQRLRRAIHCNDKDALAQHQTAASNLAAGDVFHQQLQ